ncbi:hypothetical protein OGAPHI_006591 [Ogataea philodendri]|uniref:Uncharacterized protein n=1 Tax=Ogataea philodendri TaxID=1378263 RepID=A0A9P8NY48_9ASCO|nr:uncharacterized protein OGAPHI_006591 [Ogataea philodendri]KAH3661184.1 hypothetical protein OGAPHI_006591 [Ogataea philodendri]
MVRLAAVLCKPRETQVCVPVKQAPKNEGEVDRGDFPKRAVAKQFISESSAQTIVSEQPLVPDVSPKHFQWRTFSESAEIEERRTLFGCRETGGHSKQNGHPVGGVQAKENVVTQSNIVSNKINQTGRLAKNVGIIQVASFKFVVLELPQVDLAHNNGCELPNKQFQLPQNKACAADRRSRLVPFGSGRCDPADAANDIEASAESPIEFFQREAAC